MKSNKYHKMDALYDCLVMWTKIRYLYIGIGYKTDIDRLKSLALINMDNNVNIRNNCFFCEYETIHGSDDCSYCPLVNKWASLGSVNTVKTCQDDGSVYIQISDHIEDYDREGAMCELDHFIQLIIKEIIHTKILFRTFEGVLSDYKKR